MNKKIELGKSAVVMFVFNLLVFFFSFLFKYYYTARSYYLLIVNIMFLVNIVFLLVGIGFNIYIIKCSSKLNTKKTIFGIIISFIIFIIINILGTYFINKPFSVKSLEMSEKLVNYCNEFNCDKYEFLSDGDKKDFIIEKRYFDFNGIENDIEIHTVYDFSNIISIKAIVYSRKECFSEILINEQLSEYLSNFNITLNTEKIKEAFDKRDNEQIKDKNITYNVEGIYENKNLLSFKTVIKVNLK